MTKIAFMFPGQGSFEVGMGREIAEAVPEAMAVYEGGSEASGLDLEGRLLQRPRSRILLDTKVQQPALVATSLAILEAVRARGIVPDYVVGHSVGEFAALGAPRSLTDEDAIGLVRERGIAMAEAAEAQPGSMAAILGLADEVVEGICRKIANVWPANYNCPGQIVVSGEDEAVRGVLRRGRAGGGRGARSACASPGAFHSPLVARAADKLRPAVERIHFADPRTAFMSTVTARLEDASRYRELLIEQLTAPVRFTQAAGELVGKGVTIFVEVGPGNVLSGLLKRIDRSVRTVSVANLKELHELEERLARHLTGAFASLAGKNALVTGASRGSGARSLPRSRGRSDGRRRLPLGQAEAEALASEIGGRAVQADVSSPDDARRLVEEAGDLDILVNNAGLTRDGLLARMSDDDWRAVLETNLSSVFYTCRAVTRPMMKKRGGSIVNISSVVGVHGNRGQTNYGASKAGIIGFTKSLARELGSRNVRANVVAPGYVKTQLTDVLPEDATRRCSPRPRSAGSASRRTWPARYASSAPTRPRSSRARCCSSTADWGCDGGSRTGEDGWS